MFCQRSDPVLNSSTSSRHPVKWDMKYRDRNDIYRIYFIHPFFSITECRVRWMHLGWWFLLFDKFRVISWRVSLFVNNEGRILAMIVKCLHNQSDASITMQWPMRGFIGWASLLMLGIWRASACYEYFRGWGDSTVSCNCNNDELSNSNPEPNKDTFYHFSLLFD